MLRPLLLGVIGAAFLAPAASAYTVFSQTGLSITADQTTPERLARAGGGAASTCATPSTYPGSVTGGPYGVVSFPLFNAGNQDVCATRTLTATSAQCQTAGVFGGSFAPGITADSSTWSAAFRGDPRNSAGGGGPDTVNWATKIPGNGGIVLDVLWNVSASTICDGFTYSLATDTLWTLARPQLAPAGDSEIGAGTSSWPGATPAITYSWSRCPLGAGPCAPFGGHAAAQQITAAEIGQRVVARHSATQIGVGPNSVDTERSAVIEPLAPVLHTTSSSSGGGVIEPATDLLPGSECDECTIGVTPPFPLQLQGRSYDSAKVGSNGVIVLGPNAQGGSFDITCLPNPNNSPMVAPFWQDLEADGTDEGIFTATAGDAPHRRFLVEWRSEQYNQTTKQHFEAVFHEDSPVISFVYADNDGGGAAVIGAQTAQFAPFGMSASCKTGTPTPPGTRIDLVPQRPTVSGTARVGATLTGADAAFDVLGGPPDLARQWLRCNGDGASCVPVEGATATTYGLTAADIGSRLVFQVIAADGLGQTQSRSDPTGVVAAQQVVTPPDTTKPTFTKYALSRKRFRVAKASTPIAARKAPRGTTLSYTLSEAASVRFKVQQVRKGRKKGKRCVVGRTTGKRCTTRRTRGTLTRTAAAGASKLAFSGRVGARALKPGSYVIVAVARDAAGNASAPRTVAFKIVR